MNEPSLHRAETALQSCAEALQDLSVEAAQSLLEGLSEVLTVHRLGVGPTLGGHLRSTNVIESVNARVETRLRKIKRYVSPEQRRQWVALALLEAERRFNRLKGYRHLPLLQQALARHLDLNE